MVQIYPDDNLTIPKPVTNALSSKVSNPGGQNKLNKNELSQIFQKNVLLMAF